MINDEFKIKLKPNINIDIESAKKEIDNKLSKIKINSILINGKFDLKTFLKETNEKLTNLSKNNLRKINISLTLDTKSSIPILNEQISKLKLKRIKVGLDINLKETQNELKEKVGKLNVGKIQSEGIKNPNEKNKLSNKSISSFYGVLDVPTSQAKLYTVLATQEKLLGTLQEKRNLTSKEIAENYDNIIKKQEEIISNVKEKIKLNKLENTTLDDRINDLQKIQDLSVADKEAKRVSKLGKLVDTSGGNISFDSSLNDIENFLKGLSTSNNTLQKISGIKNVIQDVNNEQKKFSALFKDQNGITSEYSFVIDKATNSLYQLGVTTKKDLKEIEKEINRISKLGKLVDTTGKKISFDSSLKDIEGFAKSLETQGTFFEKIGDVKNVIKDLTNEQKQFSAIFKDENGIVTEHKFAIDKVTNSVYQLSTRTKKELSEIEKEANRLQNLGTLVDTSGKNIGFGSTFKQIEDFAKSLQSNGDILQKISNIKNVKQDLKNEQQEFTAIFRNQDGIIKEYTYAIDKVSNSVYQLGSKIKKEASDLEKEANRVSKLGKLLDTSGKNISFDSSYEDIQNFAQSLSSESEIFKKLSAVKNVTQDLNNEQKIFTATFQNQKGIVTEYTYAIDKASNSVYQLGSKTKKIEQGFSSFSDNLSKLIDKMFQWNVAMTAFYKSMEFLKKGVGFVVDLDEKLYTIALVSNRSREEVEKLKETFIDFGKETKQVISQVSQLSEALTRQGLSQAETNERMETILKLSSVAGLDTDKTLGVITSSVNALGESAKRTADILVYADNNSASSVESIGKALARVSSIAKGSGVSIEQVVAQISTLIDVTQEAPETLGNSLKSIFARFNKVNELGELNKDINDVEKGMKKAGIQFRDATGTIRPVFETLGELANKWKDLDKNTRSYIATLVAGTLQQNRFLVLMQNWDRVDKMASSLENLSSGSLEKGFATWSESLRAQINELTVSLEELWLNLISEKNISKVISAGQIFINILNAIAKHVNLLSSLVYSIVAFRISKRSGWNEFFQKLSTNLKNARTKLQSFNKETNISKRNLKTFVSEIKKTNISLTTLATKLKANKIAMGLFKASMYGLAGIGIDLLIQGTGKFLNKILGVNKEVVNFAEEFKSLTGEHKQEIKDLKSLGAEFEIFSKIVGKSFDFSKLNPEQLQNFLDINQKIADLAPEFVSHWDEEGNAIVKYGTKIEDIIKLKNDLYKIDKKNLLGDFKKTAKEQGKAIQDILDKIKNSEVILYKGKENIATGTVVSPSLSEQLKQKQDQLFGSTNEREKIKLQKEINELNGRIIQQISTTKGYKNELNEIIGQYKEILSLNLNDYFESFGKEIPQNLKNVILSTSNDLLESEILKNPKNLSKAFDISSALSYSLTEYSEKVKNVLKDLTPTDISDNITELQDLIKELEGLGVSSDVASNYITNLAIELSKLSVNSKTSEETLIGLKQKMEELTGQVTSLQNIFQKASTGTLTWEESFKFLEENEEAINKINEGMDIQNAIRETSLELIDKSNAELQKELTLSKDILLAEKESLLEKQKQQQNTLNGLEKLGKKESSQYSQISSELKETTSQLQDVDAQIEKNIAKINAYQQLNKDYFNKEQFKTISEQFKKATDNILKYREMLDTLNSEGITGKILQDIIANYPDLLNYIDDEIVLKEKLNNLVKEEEVLQQNSYKLKLMYSTNFANAFMRTNTDMINKLSEKYGVDLQNFTTLQSKKMALLDGMNNRLSKFNVTLDSSISNMTTSEINSKIQNTKQELVKLQESLKGGSSNSLLIEQIQQKNAEINALTDALSFSNSIDTSVDKLFSKVDFNKINASTATINKTSKENAKQREKLDLVKLEVDEYLKLNKELEKNNRLKEQNNKLIQYASGKDRIQLIQKENDLLTQRQKLLHNLANQYREEQKQLENVLSKNIKIKDSDSGISSYTTFMKTKQNEINNVIKQINSTNNESLIQSLTEKKDLIQKQVDKISNEYKRYLEIVFNSIPSLQDEYSDLAFQKFDNLISLMQTRVEKFQKSVDRLELFKSLKITSKNETEKDLKNQLELQKEIVGVYLEQLKVMEEQTNKSKKAVNDLEIKLSSISDKSSSDYKNTQTSLIQAKKLSEEAIAIYENSVKSYADALNNRISVELQLLDKIKENTKKSILDLRSEKNNFGLNEFENSIESIQNALDKIDNIFISNPVEKLDTSETRNNLESVLSTIENIRRASDNWKSSIDKINKSNKSNKQIIEEIKKITEKMVKAENKLTEEIEKRKKENDALRLEYERIENSLQNLIDKKQEEIENYKEEINHNQKVNSLLEARLNLLKSMDDTSYQYITGTGEVEWTYNKSQVSENLKQLANLVNQDVQEQKLSKMEAELKKMTENLEKTQKIHEQNLSINEAQLNQLEKERDYLTSLIDKSVENLDTNFDNIMNKYITEMNNSLKQNTSFLSNIYDLLKEQINSNSFSFQDFNKRSVENLSEKYGVNSNVLENLTNKLNADTTKYSRLVGSNIDGTLRNVPFIDGFGNKNNIFNNSSNNNDTSINIQNVNLPNVHNPNDFLNQLGRMARNGIERLN